MTETTHIICAHCGKDNTISNYFKTGTLSLTKLTYEIVLMFACKYCKHQYKLPVEQPNNGDESVADGQKLCNCYASERISMYWAYLKYVIEHKKNVGIECLRMGMPLHAITHDLSKLRPSEFIPYAKFFYSKNRPKNYKQSDEDDPNFQKGWNHHQKRNKHHWNYWVSVTRAELLIPLEMPIKYVRQMVADWNGMSRKFGGSTEDYFNKNKESMILHPVTVERITKQIQVTCKTHA